MLSGKLANAAEPNNVLVEFIKKVTAVHCSILLFLLWGAMHFAIGRCFRWTHPHHRHLQALSKTAELMMSGIKKTRIC